MDSEGSSSGPPGSDNQDSNEPAPPGTLASSFNKGSTFTPLSHPKLLPSSKGVEQAKKRLRAFSIQKKSPITPLQLTKPIATGSAGPTVLIGKLNSVKPSTTKIEDESKKLRKPPKPGSTRKSIQESYTEAQKRTLAEIEDMKRKMELVDLGIPLGLICPSVNSDKAMPTKAMPPIKTFLDSTKVDEIIREAKKAKAEGREFKFDYQKILPDYDNPFQRKKEEAATQDKEENSEKDLCKSPHFPKHKSERPLVDRVRDKSKRKSDRFESSRRHSDRYDRARKDDRDKYKEKRSDKVKDKDDKKETKGQAKYGKRGDNAAEQEKEADVNLNDYLVCDSWSLDNDDKTSSPQVNDKANKAASSSVKEANKESKTKDSNDSSKEVSKKREDLEKEALLKAVISPNPAVKMEKLQPVMDSFDFEIDPNDEDVIMFDDDSKHGKAKKDFDYNQDTNMSDSLADDNFLESVINEIKQENLSDDDSQDRGLVEYDSPLTDLKGQGTPELDDSMRLSAGSQRSDYSDSYRSVDSGCKSTESGYRSTESGSRSTESGYRSSESIQKRDKGQKSKDSRSKSSEEYKSMEEDKSDEKEKVFCLSVEKELDESLTKSTMESLEMWDFVLKICQPLLFRHDKTKCYKQTRVTPTIWWATRPGSCSCVRGRSVVLSELRAQRMPLVDRVYGTDQISDAPAAQKRTWYPPLQQSLSENVTVLASPAPPRPRRAPDTPQGETLLLDREYQRFMEAVWPEVAEAQAPSRSTTPVRLTAEKEDRKRSRAERSAAERSAAERGAVERCAVEDRNKSKLSSEGWSQESEVEDELEKSSSKKQKGEEKSKEKARKRKRSSSTLSSTTEDDDAKRRKTKKKITKKSKAKLAKRRRTEKKYLKKLKDKQKKKKQAKGEEEEVEAPKKKQKDKKSKKKQQKQKKTQKKKKYKPKSSSSSSSSSESEDKKKKRKKKKKEAAFDVNILNNIKTEKLTDDEKCQIDQEFSPRRQQEKRHEIINVKEFDLGIQIKQEVVEEERREMDEFDLSNNDEFMESNVEKIEFKEPQERLTPQRQDETNLSQCSSQESICSEKPPVYEKDESHLRPSSQNSNYSFNDVIASQSGMYSKGMEIEEKFEYEQENYEMYEQLAMAYQSDVASNQVPLPSEQGTQRIETVVRRRCGEIKCDWRAGADKPAPQAARPSRWGLKPGEVNIVLTGGGEQFPAAPAPAPVYRIESIANRNDTSTGSYDEAYMDTYGAMDLLQYGDCFSAADAQMQSQSQQQSQRQSQSQQKERRVTLDDRIDQALRHTVLGDIAMEPENKDGDADKDNRERGILITAGGSRGAKRVSFADGYKPGQDSDTEDPPAKKRSRSRRLGCAWPCPASHADHVPLWDALPPPPPPPGSPPPPPHAAPPLHLLRHTRPPLLQPPHHAHKFDPTIPVPGFMPPEPPPGLITFQ